MHTFSIANKTISVFASSTPNAPVIYLNTFSGEGQKIFQAAQDAHYPSFTLIAISDLDWDHDMAPWDCPPIFKNTQPCTGGADDYLKLLTETIVPTVENNLAGPPCWRGITGYSLAGLFAVYAIYQTDLFSRVGSMSGSLWFPGIKEYIFSHEPKCWPNYMYFSLGDKESKTRNPILQSVQSNTEEIQTFYQKKGINTVFQQNSGNHYNHATERTTAGIGWLLSR